MSKSLNNVYLLKDITQKGYDPLTYRLFTYSSSYRTKLNFTWEGIEASQKALEKLRAGYQKHLEGNEDILDEEISKYEENFHKAINDDLNMPLAMSVVWDVVKNPKKSKKLAKLLEKFDTVLALSLNKKSETQEKIPGKVIKLAEERLKARTEKNWAESDRLRNEILALGYSIKDSKEGYELSR